VLKRPSRIVRLIITDLRPKRQGRQGLGVSLRAGRHARSESPHLAVWPECL